MAQKNIELIPGIGSGQVITARHLNKLSSGINKNSEAVGRPKQKESPVGESESETESGSGLTDLTFNETSRTETTVTTTDSNGDTLDIAQTDSIVLENSSGDVLTLNFTNP